MGNYWLDLNKVKIETLKRQLMEYAYKGSYGGEIPLMDLRNVLTGAQEEIKKLQSEVDNLRKQNEIKK